MIIAVLVAVIVIACIGTIFSSPMLSFMSPTVSNTFSAAGSGVLGGVWKLSESTDSVVHILCIVSFRCNNFARPNALVASGESSLS